MADEPTYLTQEGAEELQRELKNLVEVRRPQLVIKLKEAVAQGDLKENADYHDTKEQMALCDGRIQYLEELLRSAEIISGEGKKGVINIGSTVTIRAEEEEEDETYTIVGPAEANPREGRISQKSPIGAALLGHKKGDKVRVQTPSGEMIFKVKKIQ